MSGTASTLWPTIPAASSHAAIRAEVIADLREAFAAHRFEVDRRATCCVRCGQPLDHTVHLRAGIEAADLIREVLGEDFPVRAGLHGTFTVDGGDLAAALAPLATEAA